ncbi:transcriptional regulator [Nocardia sp. NPDC004278]
MGQLSRPKAADLLQMNPRGIDLLLDSGYLPDLDIDRILRLAARFTLESDGDQPVLRQALISPALDGDPKRKVIGESATLSNEEVVESDRMYWRSNPELIVAAQFLPVTLAGFPVTVLKVAGVDGDPLRVPKINKSGDPYIEIRHAYTAKLVGRVRELGVPELDYIAPDLTVDDREVVKTILGGRSTARSGGPIAYLPKTAAA